MLLFSNIEHTRVTTVYTIANSIKTVMT